MLENGLLLGSFAAKHLHAFTEEQLVLYDRWPPVTSNLTPGTCHMSPATCHLSHPPFGTFSQPG